MSAVVSIVTFPGSNCDDDVHHVFGQVLGVRTARVWHKDRALPEGTDLVVLPGGFSYGDYLRTGALARFSPIMEAVGAHARRGGTVLGICNGFQILCEAGFLPGALIKNRSLSFICDTVPVRVETERTRFTSGILAHSVLRLPIAHGDGNYMIDSAGLERLVGEDQVLLRYSSPEGVITDAWNPNGSTNSIAGVTNATRRVFGLMPHPERASEEALGNTDGRALLEALLP